MRTNDWLPHLLGCALVFGCTSTPSTGDDSSSGDGTSSTGVTPTSGSTGSSEGGEPAMDAGLVEGECDPWQQDCPAGLKCMAFAEPGENSFSGTKCTPVSKTPGAVGDPCHADGGWSTGVDDCDLGLACWNINPDTNEGVCAAWCTGSSDAPTCPGGANETCVFWVPGFAHVCLPLCDPLLQDCDGPEACLPNWAKNGEEWVCSLDYSMDEGQEFDPCEYSNACDPGLMCGDPAEAIECDKEAIGCCLSICDLTAPAACKGMGAECESFYGEATPPPAYANVGLCGLP